ncbi:hypothetical protein EIP91_010324 [Steccherinum ochraceum]|uniref:Uncharacterized protein n=1 Tax=Steccherinum ochraceum TaxID=92696 RepID=A0A4R0R0R5_9APHY|nr:hypothetical protein EIP91_010324 [Steccherinum ochraceum]
MSSTIPIFTIDADRISKAAELNPFFLGRPNPLFEPTIRACQWRSLDTYTQTLVPGDLPAEASVAANAIEFTTIGYIDEASFKLTPDSGWSSTYRDSAKPDKYAKTRGVLYIGTATAFDNAGKDVQANLEAIEGTMKSRKEFKRRWALWDAEKKMLKARFGFFTDKIGSTMQSLSIPRYNYEAVTTPVASRAPSAEAVERDIALPEGGDAGKGKAVASRDIDEEGSGGGADVGEEDTPGASSKPATPSAWSKTATPAPSSATQASEQAASESSNQGYGDVENDEVSFSFETWRDHCNPEAKIEMAIVEQRDKHDLNPLPAYDVHAKALHPSNYKRKLARAVVLLTFTVSSQSISSSTEKTFSFYADIKKIQVLHEPPVSESPLKRAPERDESKSRKRAVLLGLRG